MCVLGRRAAESEELFWGPEARGRREKQEPRRVQREGGAPCDTVPGGPMGSGSAGPAQRGCAEEDAGRRRPGRTLTQRADGERRQLSAKN